MIESLVHLVLYLLGVGVILAILLYLVRSSPLDEPWKGWLHWLVIAIACVIIIYVLIGLVGGSVPSLRLR